MKKIALALIAAALTLLMAPVVFACEPPPPPPQEPGLSPGFWKHDVRAKLYRIGRLHYSDSDIEAFEAYIGEYISPGFTLEWAHIVFWDKEYKYMWLTVANWFNEAAGLAPYNG